MYITSFSFRGRKFVLKGDHFDGVFLPYDPPRETATGRIDGYGPSSEADDFDNETEEKEDETVEMTVGKLAVSLV